MSNKISALAGRLGTWIRTNRIKIFLVLIGVFLAVIGVIYIINLRTQNASLKYAKEHKALKDSIDVKIDKTGHQVATTSETIEVLKEVSVEDTRKIDSLQKLLDIKPKEVIKYIEVATKTDYSKLVSAAIDSVKNQIRFYSLNTNRIKYKAEASLDSLTFKQLVIQDTLQGVFTQKKIGKDTYNSFTARNTNKYVEFTDLDFVNKEPIPKVKGPWGLGIHGGYDPFRKQPVVSVGVNYTIIRFNKKR